MSSGMAEREMGGRCGAACFNARRGTVWAQVGATDLSTQILGVGVGGWGGTRLGRTIWTAHPCDGLLPTEEHVSNATSRLHLKGVETLTQMNKLEVGTGTLG